MIFPTNTLQILLPLVNIVLFLGRAAVTTQSSIAAAATQLIPATTTQLCFNCSLYDSFGDGWNGAKLKFKTGEGGSLVAKLTQTEPFPAAGVAQTKDVCFNGCGCYFAKAGNGEYDEEISWKLGEIAEGTDEGVEFCIYCTSCGKGLQPNDADNGCEPCKKGTFSDTEDTSPCQTCSWHTFTSNVGSETCQPCEEGLFSKPGSDKCVPPIILSPTNNNELLSAIEDANPGDIVSLSENEMYSPPSSSSDTWINIITPMTIECKLGRGGTPVQCTLDADGNGRCMKVNNVNDGAVLKTNRITIKGGSTNGNGGGMYIGSSTVTMTSTTVSGNTAVSQPHHVILLIWGLIGVVVWFGGKSLPLTLLSVSVFFSLPSLFFSLL